MHHKKPSNLSSTFSKTMAKISFSCVVLLTIISIATAIEPTQHKKSRYTAFTEEQCRGTQYFQLCVRSLSMFATSPTFTQTPEQLAQLAIRISLVRARLASQYITEVAKDLQTTKSRNYQAVIDCLQQINDGVDQLRNSVRELGKMSTDSETDNFSWHRSNVNSWLSTAQTDALTCLDGFSGHAIRSRMKATIRAKVLNVAEVTSNALDFFSRYVERCQASRSHTKP